MSVKRKIHTEGRSELPKRQKPDTPPDAGWLRPGGIPAIPSGCDAKGPRSAPAFPPTGGGEGCSVCLCARVSSSLMSEPAPGSAGRQRNRAQPSLSRCSPAVGGLVPPASPAGQLGNPARPIAEPPRELAQLSPCPLPALAAMAPGNSSRNFSAPEARNGSGERGCAGLGEMRELGRGSPHSQPGPCRLQHPRADSGTGLRAPGGCGTLRAPIRAQTQPRPRRWPRQLRASRYLLAARLQIPAAGKGGTSPVRQEGSTGRMR